MESCQKGAVTFTDGSELPHQHNASLSVSPEERAERCAHRTGRGEGREGREEEVGGNKTNKANKKLMHKMEGELFPSLSEISDIKREQLRRAAIKPTTSLVRTPRAKSATAAPHLPSSNRARLKRLKEKFSDFGRKL